MKSSIDYKEIYYQFEKTCQCNRIIRMDENLNSQYFLRNIIIQMRTFIILFTLLLQVLPLLSRPFKLIKHPFQSGAKCLDGSPSAIYFYEGEQNDKFVLYFEGGGVCEGYTLEGTLKNCHQRSKTHLGSSSEYPEIRDFSRFTILSSSRDQNPLYYNWSKAFIPYCDGSMHQGSRLEPVSYSNDKLFFRGANNTLAHFDYLDKEHGLFKAKNTIVSGTSAGAAATLLWGNTVYKRSKHPEGVLLIADSGIFVSDPELAPGVRKFGFISILANEQTPVPIEQCRKVYEDCATAEAIAEFLLPPVIVLQSLYDVYSIRNLLMIDCPQNSFPASLQNCDTHEMKKIEKQRDQTLNIIEKFLKNEKNSVWVISCAQHGFLYDFSYYSSKEYLVPEITGTTIKDLLINFDQNQPSLLIDDLRWPENSACNGKIPYSLRIA